MFVPLVENGYAGSQATRLIAEEYLNPLKEAGVDTLILGCTHYPLLCGVIRAVKGEGVRLVDAGAETAVYAKERLEERGLLCGRGYGSVQYYVSDTVDGFTELAGMFLEKKIEGSVHKINIENY